MHDRARDWSEQDTRLRHSLQSAKDRLRKRKDRDWVQSSLTSAQSINQSKLKGLVSKHTGKWMSQGWGISLGWTGKHVGTVTLPQHFVPYLLLPSVNCSVAVKDTGLGDWKVTRHGIRLGSSSASTRHGPTERPSGKLTSSTECKLPSSSSTRGASQSTTAALQRAAA